MQYLSYYFFTYPPYPAHDFDISLDYISTANTFASWLALQGKTLPTIKELIGHKTLEITMRYAHLMPDQKRKATLKLEQGWKSMIERTTGYYIPVSTVGDEICKAFIPNPLPPVPPLEIDNQLQCLIDQAMLSLGRLDSVSILLPDTDLFLLMYIMKEAVLSSQLEGTQSSFSDLLLFEFEDISFPPVDEIQEVSNYVRAVYHGLKRLRGGFPLSLRLMREIHEILLTTGRGSEKTPGEFRRSQNWIGGTRPGNALFAPPPPDKIIEALGALEDFVHDKQEATQILIKAALTHVQFETIHPFLDGNGRVGRMLITILLCAEGVLNEPMLYLSLYFKTNRQEYYDLLQRVRTNGAWESWIRFFIEGIKDTADQAVKAAKKLTEMFEKDRHLVRETLKRSASSGLRVHHAFQKKPLASISTIAELTQLSVPTVTSIIKKLQKAGMISEITGRQRDRMFAYTEYLHILSEGTEPFSK